MEHDFADSQMMRRAVRTPLLSDAIGHHARYSPRSTAFVCENDRLSWADLDFRTARIANGLASLGLIKGDKACLYMSNSTDAFIAMWAVVRGGYVLVSISTLIEGDALAQMIGNSDARVVLTDVLNHEKIHALRKSLPGVDCGVLALGRGELFEKETTELGDRAILPDDSATILYSSGTTGTPKGIEHSHSARLAFALGFGGAIGIGGREAVSILTTPLYTNGTWLTMAPTIMRGGRIVLAPKFSGDTFLDLVERERGTHAFLVPTQYEFILTSLAGRQTDLSSLKVLLAAGLMLPKRIHQALNDIAPHVRVYQAYGMTEGFGTVASPEDYAEGKLGSVGKSFYLDDIRILDEEDHEVPPGAVGEIAAWGGGMMKGYYKDARRTEEALWHGVDGRTLLRSGDMGYLDEDGFLYISGRKKDMIKSGGINIFAVDLEAEFLKHPDVKEAAAIAIPHEKWGETPHVAIILNDGAAVTEEELRSWVNNRLAKYQRISSVEFRDDFPRAAYGKVNKAAMRESYWKDQ